MRESTAVVTTAVVVAALVYVVYVSFGDDKKRRRALQLQQKSAATDFTSFLVDGGRHAAAAMSASSSSAAAAALTTNGTNGHTTEVDADAAKGLKSGSDGRTLPLILCLYGTATGFSKEVAELVRDRLRDRMAEKLQTKAQEHDDVKSAIVAWNMRDYPAGIPFLHLIPIVVAVCSTQGDGVPPPDALEFIAWLLSCEKIIERTVFTVAALGDRSYPHFCRCGRQLDERLAAIGGRRVVPRIDVDGEDYEGIDEWIALTEKTLFGGGDEAEMGTHMHDALVDTCMHARLANEAEFREIVASSASSTCDGAPRSGGAPARYSRDRPQLMQVVERSNLCTPRNLRYHGTEGDAGLQNGRKNSSGNGSGEYSDKRTVCIHLSTKVQPPPSMSSSSVSEAAAAAAAAAAHEPLIFEPGDAIGIFTENSRADVMDLITALQVDPSTRVDAPAMYAAATTARRCRRQQLNENGMHRAEDETADGKVSIYDALSFCYDVKTPKRSMWKLLYEALVTCACDSSNGSAAADDVNASSSDMKRRQLALLLEGGIDPGKNSRLRDFLAHHYVADILRTFACPHCLENGCEPLGTAALLRHLRSLSPRLYSISSSPLEAQDDALGSISNGALVTTPATPSPLSWGCQITVAVVEYYDAVVRKHRTGVASTFLSDRLAVGDLCAVFIERNNEFRLPSSHMGDGEADSNANVEDVDDDDDNKPQPLLMIGPGTGIAPFRAFIMHQLLAHSNTTFSNHLYFGCRHQHHDFLYGALLKRLSKEGVLRLRTAFSRDQPQRRYVQHCLWEDRTIIWNEIIRDKRSIIYVCGDASHMAHDVNSVLIDIILWGLNGCNVIDGSREEEGGQEKVTGKVLHTREAAVAYLDMLSQNNRYRRDVWVS